MARVATRRLIDASASLDAADRALLNLWINHGLADPALARMTGMEPAVIADRRLGIVVRLSEELGLPPDEVGEALAEVAASSAAPPADEGRPPPADEGGPPPVDEGGPPPGAAGPPPEEATPPPDEQSPRPKGEANSAAAGSEDAAETPGAQTDPSLNGRAPAGAVIEPPPSPAPEAQSEGPPPSPPAPEAESEGAPPATDRARRRVLWATSGTVLALLVAGILVIALSSTSGGQGKPNVRPSADTTTPAPASSTEAAPTTPSGSATSTAPTGSTTSTVPAASPGVSAPPPLPLAALPGGVAQARGSVTLTRDGKKLKLKLTVIGLPAAAHHGHYEVWLYDSIIDAKPLGRLAARGRPLTVTLPSGARHYRWIDISLQPTGFVNHSGISVLRAGNPAHASAKQLRKRVHRRRQLRRASGSSRASTSK